MVGGKMIHHPLSGLVPSSLAIPKAVGFFLERPPGVLNVEKRTCDKEYKKIRYLD